MSVKSYSLWLYCQLSPEFGERVQLVASNLVWAGERSRLSIGGCTKASHFMSLKTSTHEIDLTENAECIAGDEKFYDIAIGRGCWLCASSVVIPGVKIGDFCVAAAGGVVIHSCDSRLLLAGNPTQFKKKYEVVK